MAINYNLGDLSGLDLSGLSGQSWEQTVQGFGQGDLGGIGAALTQQQQQGPSAEDTYWTDRAAREAEERARQQEGTAAAVQAMFEQYGLGSLYPTILDYARRGYTADAIMVHIRQTPEYKARFPAMEQLAKNGRAISEAAYIDYERTAAQLEQRYGLPSGMLMGKVTDFLINDLSAAEVADRVQIAVADSIMAPDDLRAKIVDYYNLDPDTALAAYYLDPDVALPILEKQSAAARIGVWASRQGVQGFGREAAEELQGLGVTEGQAQQGFAQVAASSGLGAGRGDIASQEQRIAGTLAQNAEARTTMERAAVARRNRFAGRTAYAEDRQGVAALGSSTR